MMRTVSERITVADLAQRLASDRGHVIAELDRIGAKVETDAIGRITVDLESARKLIERQERDTERRVQLQGEYHEWLRDRAQRRDAAIHRAYTDALAAAVADQRRIGEAINSGAVPTTWATGAFPIFAGADQQARATARAAGTEARHRFDEREPELDFETWADRYRDKRGDWR
jgi:hypothetical protein